MGSKNTEDGRREMSDVFEQIDAARSKGRVTHSHVVGGNLAISDDNMRYVTFG